MWVAPRRLLHTSALLLALASPREASQYCGRLEYWNPDNRCCRSCQQRFGPPPCPDYEFVENCGLNDFGDLLTHPFKKCSPGQCNPDGAELCSPCNSGVPVPTPPRIHGRTQQRCTEKPIPPKAFCSTSAEETTVQEMKMSSLQEPWPSENSSLSWTTKSNVPSPSFVLFLVLVPLLVLVLLLISRVFQERHQQHKGVASSPSSPGLVCKDASICALSLPSSAPVNLEALERQDLGKVPLLPLASTELAGLISQPLSRLLDELEVLEELIVLLDPEPGPGGGAAYGTSRHLAARYGLPAAWSTFAYSLRPSRSPLRALIEVVAAREPSASLGQFGAHLAELGRADALRVLSKLG